MYIDLYVRVYMCFGAKNVLIERLSAEINYPLAEIRSYSVSNYGSTICYGGAHACICNTVGSGLL